MGGMEIGGVVSDGAPRDLWDLAAATIRITCASGIVPGVERLCFAGRWVVVMLSDGRAGRSFLFNGQHAVYGALDFGRMEEMRSLVGKRVDAAMTLLLETGVQNERSGHAAGRPGAATSSLDRSVVLAIVNALSCEVNAPDALRSRGFDIDIASDRGFLRSDDSVVLIGAGMLLRESATICTSVDVIDMRPRASLQSLLIDADGMRSGPGQVHFRGTEDTAALVARADVVGITGCTLENDTLFEIARLPRRAREFVVFGPSAQAPMELFGSLGVTRVVASRVIDAKSLMEGMLAEFDATGPRDACEGYLVTMPHIGEA